MGIGALDPLHAVPGQRTPAWLPCAVWRAPSERRAACAVHDGACQARHAGPAMPIPPRLECSMRPNKYTRTHDGNPQTTGAETVALQLDGDRTRARARAHTHGRAQAQEDRYEHAHGHTHTHTHTHTNTHTLGCGCKGRFLSALRSTSAKKKNS